MRDIDLNAVLSRHGLTPADLRALGFSVRAVDYWRSGGRRVSIEAAQRIHAKLHIPLHELRPDIWPPPAKPPRRREPARREAVAA